MEAPVFMGRLCWRSGRDMERRLWWKPRLNCDKRCSGERSKCGHVMVTIQSPGTVRPGTRALNGFEFKSTTVLHVQDTAWPDTVAVASLGLVSPGAATLPCHPILFFLKKIFLGITSESDDIFSCRLLYSAGASLNEPPPKYNNWPSIFWRPFL